MSFLVDTCVISELRKKHCNPGVAAWMSTNAAQTKYLSVITLGEIRHGIELSRLNNAAHAHTASLEQWLSGIEIIYDTRILPVTAAIADRWGRLSLHQPLPAADGLIAATALEHQLSIVTRNIDDFKRSGVHIINPFT